MSDAGIAMLKQFEGLRLETYADVAGVLTIGYGHTGGDVREGQVITERQAEDILRVDVARFEQAVAGAVRRDPTQNQFDAMVSLAYNIGVGSDVPARGFLGSSVLRQFNAGDVEGAATSFILWIKAGGVLQPGLITRRAREIVRFLRP